MSEPLTDTQSNDFRKENEKTRRVLLSAIKKERKFPKWWDLLAIVIPIVLGLLVWLVQVRIQAKIDEQAKGITARLSLTEEFYKRQLTVHEKIYDKMATLLEALRVERLRKGTGREFHTAIRDFYNSYNIPKLYVSPQLRSELEGLWSDIAPSEPDKVDEEAVKTRIQTIETQMSKDLHVEDIGRVSSTLWK